MKIQIFLVALFMISSFAVPALANSARCSHTIADGKIKKVDLTAMKSFGRRLAYPGDSFLFSDGSKMQIQITRLNDIRERSVRAAEFQFTLKFPAHWRALYYTSGFPLEKIDPKLAERIQANITERHKNRISHVQNPGYGQTLDRNKVAGLLWQNYEALRPDHFKLNLGEAVMLSIIDKLSARRSYRDTVHFTAQKGFSDEDGMYNLNMLITSESQGPLSHPTLYRGLDALAKQVLDNIANIDPEL